MSTLGDAITRAIQARKSQMDKSQAAKKPSDEVQPATATDEQKDPNMYQKAKKMLGYGDTSSS